VRELYLSKANNKKEKILKAKVNHIFYFEKGNIFDEKNYKENKKSNILQRIKQPNESQKVLSNDLYYSLCKYLLTL
jgi:hypothetical protein